MATFRWWLPGGIGQQREESEGGRVNLFAGDSDVQGAPFHDENGDGDMDTKDGDSAGGESNDNDEGGR